MKPASVGENIRPSGDRNGHASSPIASRLIFAAVCFVPLFSALMFGAVDVGAIAILTLPSVFILLLWTWLAVRGGTLTLSGSLLQVPLIALAVLGMIQLLPLREAGIPDGLISIPAISSLSLDPYATRIFLVRLLLYIVFFSAALTFIRDAVRIRAVAVTIVIFGSLLAFYSILQRVEVPGSIYGMRTPFQAVPFGTYVNRHHFAALMEMTLGLTLGLAFAGGLKINRLPFLIAAAAVMGVAMALTGSRGAMIGLAAAMIVVIGFASSKVGDRRSKIYRPRVAALAAAGTMFILVVGVLALFTGGGESLMRGIGLDSVAGDVSSGRLQFWRVALKIFADHPLVGAGLDSFGVAYPRYDPANGTFRVEQAHNDYLQILAEGGIAGISLAVVFVYLLIRRSYEAITASRDNFCRAASVGALAGCVAVLVHSLFDFPLRTPANAYFFLLLAAIACANVKKGSSRRKSNRAAEVIER